MKRSRSSYSACRPEYQKVSLSTRQLSGTRARCKLLSGFVPWANFPGGQERKCLVRYLPVCSGNLVEPSVWCCWMEQPWFVSRSWAEKIQSAMTLAYLRQSMLKRRFTVIGSIRFGCNLADPFLQWSWSWGRGTFTSSNQIGYFQLILNRAATDLVLFGDLVCPLHRRAAKQDLQLRNFSCGSFEQQLVFSVHHTTCLDLDPNGCRDNLKEFIARDIRSETKFILSYSLGLSKKQRAPCLCCVCLPVDKQ